MYGEVIGDRSIGGILDRHEIRCHLARRHRLDRWVDREDLLTGYNRRRQEDLSRRALHDEVHHRVQRDLTRLAPGTSLIALKGYAAPEVEQTLRQAHRLCRRMKTSQDLTPVMFGLCDMYYSRAELHTARALAEQVLSVASARGDAQRLPEVYSALGRILFALGKFSLAHKYAAQGLAVYEARRHSPYVSHIAHDPGVDCLSSQARALWHLGYPDRAMRCGSQALAPARKLSHPLSLALALNSIVALHHWRGEWRAARELRDELLTLAQRHAFPHWTGWGMMLRGEILVRQGHVEEGIALMRQGFTALNLTGAKMGLTGLSCELAWAYEETGRAAEGLPLVTEALTVAGHTGERFAVAELYRFQGQLTLQQCHVSRTKFQLPNAQHLMPDPAGAEAEACYRRALQTARRQ